MRGPGETEIETDRPDCPGQDRITEKEIIDHRQTNVDSKRQSRCPRSGCFGGIYQCGQIDPNECSEKVRSLPKINYLPP